MNDTIKEQMKALAAATLKDVEVAYDGGSPVECFNALSRFKTGAEGLQALARTAEILDVLYGGRE